MDAGNWTFIFIGWLIEFTLASTHQSTPKLSTIWIQGNDKVACIKSNHRHTAGPGGTDINNITPQPSPLTEEVNSRDILIHNLVTLSSTTPSRQVYRNPLRNRSDFSPRGPRWEPKLVVETTDKSGLANSTFVGILTGATIVFMLVWLPCYLYSETCLGGRSVDNASEGSSEDLDADDDHPPSYHEALSSRTVSTFSFTAQGEEEPPPSYDSLNVLIQNLDKRVCRVTASTSYYSYRPSTQTARVSSSRSFHGTSSQFGPTSLYRTPKKLSCVYKGNLPVRSLSFFEQPTLAEVPVQAEDDAHSSRVDGGGTSRHTESDEASRPATLQRATSKDNESGGHCVDVFSNIPDYPPPTYREECGSSLSSESSSFLTVIEVNDESNTVDRFTDMHIEDEDDNVVIMSV